MTRFKFSGEVEARDLVEAWSIISNIPNNLSPAEVHLWEPFTFFEVVDEHGGRAVTAQFTDFNE